MNEVEELLNQAQAKIKKMCQESYHEGFADAEGALDIMQKRFNEVQGVLLKALGRRQRMMESTIDTAIEVAKKLKNDPTEYMNAYNAGYKAAIEPTGWSWQWSNSTIPLPEPTYKYTYTEVPVTPITCSEREIKTERLVSYFEKRAKENKKRADKLDERMRAWSSPTPVQDTKSSYYFSGKSEAYAKAAQKVRELLG